MHTNREMEDYMCEIRKTVCSRCIDRPPGGPPCAPLGRDCAVEAFLPLIVKAVHYSGNGGSMDPYIDNLRRQVCSQCTHQEPDGFCLLRAEKACALDYLFPLVVQAVETVDQRRSQAVNQTSV
jgi:hypothetical protein